MLDAQTKNRTLGLHDLNTNKLLGPFCTYSYHSRTMIYFKINECHASRTWTGFLLLQPKVSARPLPADHCTLGTTKKRKWKKETLRIYYYTYPVSSTFSANPMNWTVYMAIIKCKSNEPYNTNKIYGWHDFPFLSLAKQPLVVLCDQLRSATSFLSSCSFLFCYTFWT